MQRCMFLTSECLMLLILASSSYAYVVSPKESSNYKEFRSVGAAPKVCNTVGCKDFAALLKISMNTSVDPCKDFFQYTCGGWIAKNPIPASKSSWATFDITTQQVSTAISNILKVPKDPKDPLPVNQARDFYAACMDTAALEKIGLQPLLDLLSSFGGWPMTLKYWNAKVFSNQKTLAAITRLYSPGVLLYIYNGLDAKNSSKNVIYIDQAAFILPREELVKPSSAKEDINAYTAFITEAAKAIRNAQNSSATNSQISADVADMLKFEYALAKITTPDEDRRDSSRMYNPLTVSQLQSWTDSINTTAPHAKVNWLQLLNDIYQVGAGINIPKSEKVVVVETGYLKKLAALLDKTPLRTIANYVHWNLVYILASTTNQKMKDLLFQFRKVTLGVTQQTPLNETCANIANDLLGFAVSYKYVLSNFDDASRKDNIAMVAYLKKAFKSLVTNATWMDSATKKIAKDKVDYMVANVGYPDWMTNKTALQIYYNTLSTSRTNYFGTYKNSSAFFNAQDFKMLRGPTDRSYWQTFMFPDVVNAFYDPTYNAITLPAGILQFPFYKRDLLAALNYGGTGASTIGHEITHGFDDEGSQFDKYGNIANWWTNATYKNYLSRAQCFIDQYGNYTIPGGAHLNGVNTQGENIADNGGLREGFLAYKLWVAANGVEPKLPGFESFTSEQLFYLSYAYSWCGTVTPQYLNNMILTDPHSPYNFRVNGPVSNDENFARQFKCPVGSPMNPKNKCIIW